MKITTLVLLLLLASIVPVKAIADWQADLKAVFDNVDTFDNLQDWTPAHVTMATIQNYPSDFAAFTNRTDGGMVWQATQVYYMPTQNAIQDHGADFRFTVGAANNSTTHKSLIIDYNMKDTAHSLGAQRLVFQTGYGTGQSPSTGYDEMFFFHMAKFPWGFFLTDGPNKFNYMHFLKLTCVSAGFNIINQWGTTEEYASQVADWAAIGNTDITTSPVSQAVTEYGSTGWYFFEPYASGTYLGGAHIPATFNTTTQLGYIADPGQVKYDNPGWGEPVFNSDWVAIEQRLQLSSPDGADNGEAEVWIYDKNGVELYHTIALGLRMVRDGSSLDFNHKLNKIEFGGNRYSGFYSASAERFGAATGANSQTVLIDSAGTFGTLATTPVGQYLWNSGDMSYCIVTARDSNTQLTCDGLRGGTKNTFEAGDAYALTFSYGPTEHWYVDDVIIHGSQIAPTYFAMLNGTTPPPSQPGPWKQSAFKFGTGSAPMKFVNQ